jgi:DNA polymerase-3 subunit beta
MATDLEQGIRFDVAGVEVEIPGTVLLPIARFGLILRESSDETLRIQTDGQGILIEGTRSEFRLPGEDPLEFPPITEFQEKSYYELPARLFREMVRRTIFAVDPETNRYALGGVLFEPDGEKLTAVSTDGRRLAKMEGPVLAVGQPESAQGAVIIPARAMQLMERALSDADAEIQFAPRASDVLVKSQRATIYARLLEGRFPRWRDVIPVRQDPARVQLPVGPLDSAVRQARIATSDESRGVDFTFQSGALVLSGRAADVGQSRVELPLSYEGKELTIVLDPRFLGDFLRVLDGEKMIQLELTDAESAAVATTDDGYTYVIMPLSRERNRV